MQTCFKPGTSSNTYSLIKAFLYLDMCNGKKNVLLVVNKCSVLNIMTGDSTNV